MTMPMPGVYQKVAEGQQSGRTIGTVENPKRFKGQDFYSIRDTCYRRNQLFEDETFPANVNSIGLELLPREKLSRIQWERPKQIEREACFFLDGASIFDILQGEVGDCWVLSAVGALTLHQKYLNNVIPRDQEFSQSYAGVFHFRFWQFGEWVDVVIDDRLPTLDGNFLSVHSRSRNEFWPPLLEKAYAKLRGSYQNLHWGFISESLVDFTGGVQMDFDLTKPPPDLRDIVVAAVTSGSLMGCTTPGGKQPGNSVLKNGLVQGHAYTVTDATQICCNLDNKQRMEDIIQVWNPWGNGEWNGPWSDSSREWGGVSPEVQHKLNVQKNDGEFWISCQDFLQNFNSASICNHTPAYLDFENPKRAWQTVAFFNRWVKGSTAGGYSPIEDLWRNPQYVITVPEMEGTKRGYNLTVALMQHHHNENMYRNRWMGIGFALCRVSSKVVNGASQQTYSSQQVTDTSNSGIESSREVTRSFKAPPGTYVIIPFTESKGQESEFLLRIFLKTNEIDKSLEATPTRSQENQSFYSTDPKQRFQDKKSLPGEEREMFYSSDPRLRYQDGQSEFTDQTESYFSRDTGLSDFSSSLNLNSNKVVPQLYRDDSYEKVFVRYCTKSSELYAEQLQRLLNEVIITDQTLVANRGNFTLDTCRGILMLMDLDANGRLNLAEFGRLWKRLGICKDLFRSIDVKQSGFLDVSGLRQAVHMAGLPISDAVISVMIMRYSNASERLSFADFVSSIIRLESVTRVFKNLSKDGRGVYLSAEQWMQILMSS